MPTLVLALFLAFFVLQTMVEAGLVLLNIRHLRRLRAAGAEVPAPLRQHVDPEMARKSSDYTLANARFALVRGAYGAVLTLVILLSGVLPSAADYLSRHALAGSHLFVVFLAGLSAVLSLAHLPFGLYHTFAIESRFDFNRTTWRLWLVDRVKGILLSAAIGVPLLYAVYGFMALTGRWWWLWLFAFLVAVQVVMLWAFPVLIAPIFNKFVPLPDGDLKQRLETLARDAGFRNRGLFVVDASRRSRHSNAYFTGLFRPRIVLYDTLVDKMTTDEAAAVLAHEIGHYKARHIHKRLGLSLAGMLVGLFVLSKLIAWPPLFQAFGFAAPSFHAALALFSLGGGAFTFYLEPVGAWLSRRDEYEADRFSVRLARQPEAMKSALIRMSGENLSNLTPHPWYSRWHYSHPTLLERMAAIDLFAAAETAQLSGNT
jgi:STE24 endopeptidase